MLGNTTVVHERRLSASRVDAKNNTADHETSGRIANNSRLRRSLGFEILDGTNGTNGTNGDD